MEAEDTDVLLTCRFNVGLVNKRRWLTGRETRTGGLLALDESRRPVYADDETTRDFRVKRSAVTSLFNSENPSYPSYNLV